MGSVKYSKSKYLQPCRLLKNDIISLVNIIKTDIKPSSRKEDFVIYSNLPNFSIRENDLDSFFNNELLPKKINRLCIEIIGWNEDKDIDKTIYITFYDNYVLLSIRGDNNTWVSGIYLQLTDFLRKKRPWFWFLNRIFPVLAGIFIPLSIFAFKYLILNKSYLLSISTGIFFILVVIAAILNLQGIFPPYTQIIIEPKKSIISPQKILIIFAILTFFVTLIGVIVTMLK